MSEMIVTNTYRSLSLIPHVEDYVKASKARNTQRAIKKDWETFTAWCEEEGLKALPASPETVAGYLASKAEVYKVSTLRRHLSTISQAHEAAGVTNPLHTALVKATMKGISNTKGVAPNQKKAARIDDIRRMVEELPDTLIGTRNKALLLVGFSGGFRTV